MSDFNWSGWIKHTADKNPTVLNDVEFQVKLEDGAEYDGHLQDWEWDANGIDSMPIIAYRYKIKEPESDMHPDLEWLARNVSEFASPRPGYVLSNESKLFAYRHNNKAMYCEIGSSAYAANDIFTKDEWKQARRDLGLEPSGIAEPDEDECIQLAYERINKQTRYLDSGGGDWIDEFAKTATVDEFRGAMKFTIGKYLRRAGKKDELVKEIEKMRDYCDRWIAYERSL